MFIALLILFFAYYLGSVVISNLEKDLLKDSTMKGEERVRYYKRALLWRTLPVLFILLTVAMTPMGFADLGVRGVSGRFLENNRELGVLVLAGCAVWAGVLGCKCLFGKRSRRQAFIEAQRCNDRAGVQFNLTVPESPREKRWFAFFSLISAAEKELIFRGFLFFLIINVFPALPAQALPLAPAVFMGLCNVCLGAREMGRIVFLNLMLGFLYVVLGSLLPCFLLHFVIGYASGCVYTNKEAAGRVAGG